jgi:hypothetical protein
MPFISKSPKSVATVIIAAANIFSVRDEMKIPIAIKHIPTRISAIKLPIIIATLGPSAPSATKAKSGIKLNSDSARYIRNIQSALKNLPKTSEKTDTGEVKRSWSVFVRLSSLKLLIVRIGKNTIDIISTKEKYDEVSEVGSADINVLVARIKPEIKSATPRKTYPVTVVK